MSATVASESCFLSALQPNTAVTTYAVPSDVQLGPRGSIMDEVERAKRVQQQVNLRLAEKKYSTLTRLNCSNCISPGGQLILRFSLCPILEMWGICFPNLKAHMNYQLCVDQTKYSLKCSITPLGKMAQPYSFNISPVQIYYDPFSFDVQNMEQVILSLVA